MVSMITFIAAVPAPLYQNLRTEWRWFSLTIQNEDGSVTLSYRRDRAIIGKSRGYRENTVYSQLPKVVIIKAQQDFYDKVWRELRLTKEDITPILQPIFGSFKVSQSDRMLAVLRENK